MQHCAHRLRLPAFNVIAIDLDMTNRRAEMRLHLSVRALRARTVNKVIS
jgi:hypothetical protein